jgi:hypothetical protein
MAKTMQVKVVLEIRVYDDDDETVREAIKEAMHEAIESDEFEYEVEVVEEDEGARVWQ